MNFLDGIVCAWGAWIGSVNDYTFCLDAGSSTSCRTVFSENAKPMDIPQLQWLRHYILFSSSCIVFERLPFFWIVNIPAYIHLESVQLGLFFFFNRTKFSRSSGVYTITLNHVKDDCYIFLKETNQTTLQLEKGKKSYKGGKGGRKVIHCFSCLKKKTKKKQMNAFVQTHAVLTTTKLWNKLPSTLVD